MSLTSQNYGNWSLGADDYSDTRGHKINFPEDIRSGAELAIAYPEGGENFYQPLQFHFHAPSEHTVDGKLYDAEVHFVHTYKNTDNAEEYSDRAFAVVGIFFDVEEGGDETNPFIESLWNAIDSRGTAEASEVLVKELLGSEDLGDYWSYNGSFTTPPCT